MPSIFPNLNIFAITRNNCTNSVVAKRQCKRNESKDYSPSGNSDFTIPKPRELDIKIDKTSLSISIYKIG